MQEKVDSNPDACACAPPGPLVRGARPLERVRTCAARRTRAQRGWASRQGQGRGPPRASGGCLGSSPALRVALPCAGVAGSPRQPLAA